MEIEKINGAIGELLTKEKYKFLPTGLVGEICRDFTEFYCKLEEMEEANK